MMGIRFLVNQFHVSWDFNFDFILFVAHMNGRVSFRMVHPVEVYSL